MSLKVVTPPTVEPITLEEARLHLRVTPDDDSPPFHPDDTLIESLIIAARQYCENYTKRALAPQTLEIVLDAFVDEIELPMSPIASIVSIKYVDADEVEQTMDSADYVLDKDSEPGWAMPLNGTYWPGRIVPALDGRYWPTPGKFVNSVRVRYLAGYTTVADIPNDRPLPAAIKSAMLLLIGNWYENREATIVGTIQTDLSFAVEALLLPYRLRLSMA